MLHEVGLVRGSGKAPVPPVAPQRSTPLRFIVEMDQKYDECGLIKSLLRGATAIKTPYRPNSNISPYVLHTMFGSDYKY